MPGELIQNNNIDLSQTEFVLNLQEAMRAIRPSAAAHHGNRDAYIPKNISSSSHVFMRIDKVKPALSSPYSGPHRVLERRQRYFIIDVNGKKSKISIDRLKPAAVFAQTAESTPLDGTTRPSPTTPAKNKKNANLECKQSVSHSPKQTNVGPSRKQPERTVKRPIRFQF